MKPDPPDRGGDGRGSAGEARDDLFSEDAELSRSALGGEPRSGGDYLRIRREDLGGFRQGGQATWSPPRARERRAVVRARWGAA